VYSSEGFTYRHLQWQNNLSDVMAIERIDKVNLHHLIENKAFGMKGRPDKSAHW